MTTVLPDHFSRSTSCKGKGRAEDPTERTPLLPSVPTTPSPLNADEAPSLRSKLTFVFLTSSTFCITFIIVLALLAYSYAARAINATPGSLMKTALVFRGPDRVDVLNVTSSGDIWVSVDVRMGADAGSVIGVKSDPEDGILASAWKWLGQWGIQQLDCVSVNPGTIYVKSKHAAVLATVTTQTFAFPITPDPPIGNVSWLANISIVLLVRPAHNTSALFEFLQESWGNGTIEVDVDVRGAAIRGGGLGDQSWRSFVHKTFKNIQQSTQIQIPPVPGLPQPGDHSPFPPISELVTLESFDISSRTGKIGIRASATIIDPVPPTISLTSPSLPFVVSIPASNELSSPHALASVSNAPFCLTHPNITLDISGGVLPLTPEAISSLSTVISRYLSKQSNAILISSPVIPGLSVDVVFPAPDPPPRLLRDVTIRNMRIKPGPTFLASGKIFARIVLPKGVSVDLAILRILPDVLVFDGEVPDDVFAPLTQLVGSPPPPAPLPYPLPAGAFGHIRPEDWMNATSISGFPKGWVGGDEGASYTVFADMIDVPLEILPGRQKEFRKFVGKVIFGSDAVAGISGTAAVGMKIVGLPLATSPEEGGEVEFWGLPFRGSVPVNRKMNIELRDFVL